MALEEEESNEQEESSRTGAGVTACRGFHLRPSWSSAIGESFWGQVASFFFSAL
jgi:hypothetical protein